MANSRMTASLEHIQAWVEETEQVISSQASFDTFQPAEVEEIVSRFQAVLSSNLNSQQMAQILRAVSVLMYVTKNLFNMRDQLLSLLQSLLASFLSSSEKDQLSMREVNDEVLELLAQCGEDKEVKMMMLEGFARQMLVVITNSKQVDWMRNSWLKTFNMLLSGSNYKLRELLGREFAEDVEQLVDYLYTCGDYDTQSSLVETLLRFTSKVDRPQLAMSWFPNYALVQSLFVRIKDFETDCRNFLNCFNHGLGDNQLVFTLPALTCHVGEQQMFKPPDNKYRQFWVDFNLRPGSISIFHVKEENSSDLWDLFSISKDMVTSASITNQAGSTVLTLTLLTTQSVLTFTPDPQLSHLVRQIFPQPSAVKPAAKPLKCSRAAGELILPKTSCLPPAVTATQPPAVTIVQPPAVKATQPPAVTDTQPPAVTATQPPAVTATQPPAVTATQPPAVISSNLPRSMETGRRMSVAALPVKVDSKVRQKAQHTGQEMELVKYKRCSQAQPVRLVAKSKGVVEEVDKFAEATNFVEEQKEAKGGKLEEETKTNHIDYFVSKKLPECCVVIEEGARVKAREAFQARVEEEKLAAAQRVLEDEAVRKAHAEEIAVAKEEARVAAQDEAAALERDRVEAEKLKAEKKAAVDRAEKEDRERVERETAALERERTKAEEKVMAERKAMLEAKAKEKQERIEAEEKKELEEVERQAQMKAFEEAKLAAEKKAVEALESERIRLETKERAKLEKEKEALVKAEEEEKARVEDEAFENARVLADQRAVEEANMKMMNKAAAKEKERVKMEKRETAKAERKAKKEAARAKEEEVKEKAKAEKKAANEVLESERIRLETEKELAEHESEKEAMAKAEEEEKARVEAEAFENARVLAEQREVEEANEKLRSAAKEREKVKVEARAIANAERKAKKEAARAKEEEEKEQAKTEKRIDVIAEMKADWTEAEIREDKVVEFDNRGEEDEANDKKIEDTDKIMAADLKSAPSAIWSENEDDGFIDNQDEFEDMVEIEEYQKSEDGAVVQAKVADIDDTDEGKKISETPKSWNVCPDSEADYLSASPSAGFTLSGGRRRAKRKLSITKRDRNATTKSKSIKLSFNSTNNGLSVLPPESSVMLNFPPRACSPPPCCPSPPPDGSPIAQQQTKNPGKEKESLGSDISHMMDEAPAVRDVETDCSDGRVNKMDYVKKTRRSSFKKKLLSNKSLLLEMDVSESSANECVNPVHSSKVQAPSYEEVYSRETKKQKNDKKEKVSAKHKASSKDKTKKPISSADDDSILPPLVVSRISNTSDLGSSLMSTSNTTASSKKFFKTKFRQSLGSSISSWTDSLLGGVKKKRKTYSKTVVRKMTLGAGCQDDPYNTLAISPLVENVSLKPQKSKPERRCVSSRAGVGRSKRSSSLFSDDEEMEITTGETSLMNPSSIFISKKTSAIGNRKGVISKRKPSPSPTLLEEPESSSLPPLINECPPPSYKMQPYKESAGGDKGDQDTGELEAVLICTMRVLEMMARKGMGGPKHREMWGQIRRIAEMEEERE